jgi:hypothetical protein
MKKEHIIWGLIGLVVGVMGASKFRSLPLVDKLPSF